MNRPLLIGCIIYMAGILTGTYSNFYIAALLSVTVLLLIVFAFRKYLIYALVFLIVFNVGVANTFFKSNIRSAAESYSGKYIEMQGTYLETVKTKDDKVDFLLRLNKVDDNEVKEEKVRISYYGDGNKKFDLNYGDLVSVNGKMELPNGARNPGGFDYKRYLASKGIYATASSSSFRLIKQGGGDYSRIVMGSFKIKDRMLEVIEKSLPKNQSALLKGIVLSETDSLDEEIKNNFSNSGLSHLMAVSGVNVAFIVAPLLLIFRRFQVREWISVIIITLTLLIFTIITGSSPSVVRAVIMSLVVLYAPLLGRQNDVMTSIGFSAGLILLYNPLTIFDIGFQLSYGATMAIILLYKKLDNLLVFLPKYLKETVAVTLSAQIGVTPIIIYYFNKLSLISLFSNILAAPLSGVILVLGLLMAVFGQVHILVSKILAGLNYFLLTILLFLAEKSVAVPFSSITVATPKLIGVLMYYVIVLAVVLLGERLRSILSVKRLVKAGAVAGISAVLFIAFYTKPLEISFIDVGQGDAIFIRTPENKTVLIDGGSAGKEDFDVGEKILVPFLLDKGIKKIDIIVLSHGDSDHTNGLLTVAKSLDVGALVVSDKLMRDREKGGVVKKISTNKIKVISVTDKSKVEISKNTYFEALEAANSDNGNDSSLVMRLNYKKRKFLFTGDVSSEAEKDFSQNKSRIDADLVKVAHHGSKYSTSEEFLEAANPKIAVISVGKNNFGHPSKEVIDRLLKRNIKVFRTDKNGAVTVLSNGDYIKLKTMSGEKMRL